MSNQTRLSKLVDTSGVQRPDVVIEENSLSDESSDGSEEEK